MFKIKSLSLRIVIAIGLYAALVVVASLAFYWMRQGASADSPIRYAYIFCGPALSLFTHMGYFLFALQSLMLIPLLLLGAIWKKAIAIALVGFWVLWLGIGWYMFDLF